MEKLSNSKFDNLIANELSNMDNVKVRRVLSSSCGSKVVMETVFSMSLYLKSVLLIIILCPFLLFGCKQNETGVHDVKDDIAAYMSYVNKAELNLIDDNLDAAFLNFQHAFGNLHTIYAKDLYNASIVCFKLNQEEKGFSFLKQLIEKGLSINEILETKYYSEISQKDNDLWQSIRKLAVETDVSESVSVGLFNQMDSLFYMDQLFRNKIRPNPYPVYGDTIELLDDSNFKYLLNTIQSGFPSEDKIGTHNIYGYLPHYIVIHHVFERYGSKCSQILDSAINRNQIHPYYYSYLKDIGHSTFMGDFGNIALHDMDRKLLREIKGDLKKEINNNRRLIGLSSLDDYHTKVEYVLAGKKEYLFHVNAILDPRSMLPPKPSSN